MTKGEQYFTVHTVIPAIPYKNPFPVFHPVPIPREIQIGRGVLKPHGKGFRQLATGIGQSIKQIHLGFADRFSAQIAFQNSFCPVNPWHFHRTAILQHHCAMGLNRSHRFNKRIVTFGHAHMCPVVPFRFIAFRQAGKHHGHIGTFGRLNCLGNQCLIRRITVRSVSGSIGNRKSLLPGSFQGPYHPVGVNVTAAAALITGRLGKSAEESNFLPAVQWQHAIIFQQYHALAGNITGQPMVPVPVKYRMGIPVFQKTPADMEDAFHGSVQNGFLQPAFPNSPYDLSIIYTSASGHLQILAGNQPGYPVVTGAPVRHNISVKSPFLPQDFRQQAGTLGHIFPVDPIVAAHDCPWLCLADHLLKRSQVNLPQGSLIDFSRNRHTPFFLIVGGKVFYTYAHMLALNPFSKGSAQLSGQIRILGIVFKIPTAQGTSLDIDSRPKEHADIFGLTFIAQCRAHLPQQFRVKR